MNTTLNIFQITDMKLLLSICIAALTLTLSACRDSEICEASGTFEATEIIVSAEAQGKLLRFDVLEGMQLKANEIVGQIDSLPLELEKKSIEAQINALSAKAPDVQIQIAALEESLRKQIFERERTKKLIESKSANQKQLDDILAEIEIIEKNITAKKSTLDKSVLEILKTIDSLKAQIAILDDKIEKSKIKNPIDGTVLTKYAENHEVASFGKPLYKIADIENLFLRAYFTANQLDKIKLGDKMKIYADFGRNNFREYEGVVAWISDKSEFTPKGIRTKDERADLVYAIKLAVKNDGYLKIGQYAEIK